MPEQANRQVAVEEPTSAEGNAAASQSSNVPGGESLDKVRDILFGSQARQYEKRFARLEERLIKESADLRDELRRRFDSLEAYAKKEFEAMTDRLNAERDHRDQSIKTVTTDLKETAGAFDKRTSQLDEQLTRGQRELREQILAQSKALADEIRQKYEQNSAALEREARELRDEKTDRSALAAMFTELAMRLKNEFRLPGPEETEQ
jgi:hypothetical protein